MNTTADGGGAQTGNDADRADGGAPDTDGLHQYLADRIEALWEAHEENGVDQDFEVDVHYDGSELTSISITPNELWHEEGDLGFDTFHVVLGPRGGVRTAKRRPVLAGTRDYSDRKRAFEQLVDAVRRSS